MRTILITVSTLLCCCSLRSYAQMSVGDSLHYYRTEEGKYYHRIWDSIGNMDSTKYYHQRVKHLKERSKAYTAFVVFGESVGADFSAFNAAIAKDGYGPINGPLWGVGVGISHKGYSGVIVDFTYGILAFNRTVKYNGGTIETNYANLAGLELGYAVVNGRRFDIYPYAGLSARFAGLSYSRQALINSNYNSIASLVADDVSASGQNIHLAYQAGLGIDWVIAYKEKHHAGTMLFGKFGTDSIFGNESYTIDNVRYASGIKYGAWAAQLGLKFFGR